MTTATHIHLLVRPMTPSDNSDIAQVIREVSAECGLTADKGYTVSDPNLDHLFDVYSQPRSAYWVVELDGKVVGGGGIAPLEGADITLCELQKMYFCQCYVAKGWPNNWHFRRWILPVRTVLPNAIWKRPPLSPRLSRYTKSLVFNISTKR